MTAASDTPPTRFSALVVDDDAGIRQSLRLCLEAMGAWVFGVGSRAAAVDATERTRFDVVLLDLWLGQDSGLDALGDILTRQPDTGVILITAFATFESAVEAIRRGATDYLPKPFSPEQVRLAVTRVLEKRALRGRVKELEARVASEGPPNLFATDCPGFSATLEDARRIAASEATVLLRGESGTGKNVFAAWIRDHSPRSGRPFVAVNCPSLSSDLMSSTLFGHRRGAFTGAVADQRGKVQEAEGGTLFLDEVGDLNPDAQVRLLRFLNDRTFERLGETNERRADVRLIAATNRPLEALVAEGSFREDLLYRLNVLTLLLPPLRDRRADVLPLARHYLQSLSSRQGRRDLSFGPAALAAIESHPWPGNLRELRNAVERAVILARTTEIQPEDLGLPSQSPERPAVALGAHISAEAIEREHIARVLLSTPTFEAAARVLGIDATTLQRKRRRYGLA